MVGASVANETGPPEARYFLIPKSEIEIIDDWYTAGLRATGSHSLKIKKALVPAYRTAAIADMARGTAPGIVHHDAPAFRAPFPQILPFPLAGVPLGIARAALNVYLEFYRAKLAAFSPEQVADQLRRTQVSHGSHEPVRGEWRQRDLRLIRVTAHLARRECGSRA
jgi:3-hydroxy-9,10-secoandrosta-1,3,5(10)-triene-9,17-dione monooxygenase